MTYNSRKLLCHHDNCATGSSTSNTWDCEKLAETLEESSSSKDLLLDDKLVVGVKEVTGSLNFRVAKTTERFVRILDTILLEEPPR
jgi:hypothetical protein